MLAQRLVDESLIVAATGFIHQPLEMLDDIRIEANRDAFFIGTGFDHCAPFARFLYLSSATTRNPSTEYAMSGILAER